MSVNLPTFLSPSARCIFFSFGFIISEEKEYVREFILFGDYPKQKLILSEILSFACDQKSKLLILSYHSFILGN